MDESASFDAHRETPGPTLFGVDPRRPSRRLWTQAPWPSLVSGATAILTGATTLVIGSGAGYLAYTVRAGTDYLAVAIMALAALGVATLTVLAARDWWSKRRCHIVLEPDAVTLDLPAGRSPNHRPPPVAERIPLAAIASIDSRLETYGAVRQRAYRMLKRDGTMIYLFEDRALGTSIETRSLMPVAHEIAEAAGLHVTELLSAEGKTSTRLPWTSLPHLPPHWPDAEEPQARLSRPVKALAVALLLTALGSIAWAAWFVASGVATVFT